MWLNHNLFEKKFVVVKTRIEADNTNSKKYGLWPLTNISLIGYFNEKPVAALKKRIEKTKSLNLHFMSIKVNMHLIAGLNTIK